ncbi:LOW QUALITY PROTEIN: islet cell autoantigen 1-like protein [Atheta coriaria]|uniref:LOW QUALITY PROTEIN: islet cell autoantigen 1-like protein n=1 Tax=Dalotia coriaria TaxID=877792 RepID=UPI0031F44465
MKTMQQYWVTKKSVARKFGGKEDECIISSDAELDAKLELFRSITESCAHLQKVIDMYQERLCLLAQEENACGRYMKECGKNEKNASAGQILTIAGKSLAYSGHQRLTLRPSLVRLHHEVETFRGRAVSDTRGTVMEMEKTRTEYRAALSWMKSVSTQLDPDTGHGLEKFRKAQAYVKSSKVKFDRLMLACLQKVDLLAAARCNMFSHALVAYQKSLKTFSNKTYDTLIVALSRLQTVEPYDFTIVSELAVGPNNDEEVDKDKKTYFNSEYSDDKEKSTTTVTSTEDNKEPGISNDLLGEDFTQFQQNQTVAESTTHSELFGLSWPSASSTNISDAYASSEFMPSTLLQQDFLSSMQTQSTPSQEEKNESADKSKATNEAPKSSQMSWLSMFAELDPLAQEIDANVGDRA